MEKQQKTVSPTKSIKRRAKNGFECAGLHPVLQTIFAGRFVKEAGELDYRLDKLESPSQMPGLEVAVNVIEEALINQKQILFVGDFDADGATSTALGVIALKSMGAKNVGYLVPNRFEFGYGLSPEIVDVARSRSPDLLITVDNGISSIDGVLKAKSLDMSVVITDHHLPGKQLPEADAIVNPNLAESEFPSSALAGVGVIYYVMIALRSRLRANGWFKKHAEPNLGTLLDLVAVGTVADLVPLDANNRIMVRKGLERINAKRCRPGILALIRHSSHKTGDVLASDIGYSIAPRLNAAGRLTDMSLGIECLLTDDHERADKIAGELDNLNRQRRAIESDMKSDALRIVDRLQLNNEILAGVCLYDNSWHQGLVGLIAGRVKDRLHRPVAAFAKSANDELKGSVRSTPGVHIRDVLSSVDTRHPHLIERFGGHAAAAGLSITEKNLPAFERAFAEEIERYLGGIQEQGVIFTDGSLEDEEFSVDFARLLQQAGPWGQGFPEPEFDDQFDVLRQTTVGENGLHLKLQVRKQNSQKVLDAIAFFQGDEHQSTNMNDGVRLVYKLDINEYNGTSRPQLIVQYLESCSPA